MRARRACRTFRLRKCSPALWDTSDRSLLCRTATRSATPCARSCSSSCRSSTSCSSQAGQCLLDLPSPRRGPSADGVPGTTGPSQGLEIATPDLGRLGHVRRLSTLRPTGGCHVGPRLTVERPLVDGPLLDLGLRLPLHEGRVGLLQELRVDHALRRELLLDAVERVQEVYELAHALGDPIVHLHRSISNPA